MKAIVQTQYGSFDVLKLKEVERPTPGDDDVLVKVHAAGINAGNMFIKIRIWFLYLPCFTRIFI